MLTGRRRFAAAVLAGFALAACGPREETSIAREEAPEPRPVRIFAAASLADVMEDLALEWMAQGNAGPVVNLAGSSTLARQISDGAEADIFISADEQWMDWAAERSLIDPASRTVLAGNSLVLVAATGGTLEIALEPGADLAGALGDGRIALADPESVPAGRYAKEALVALSMWEGVSPKVVAAEDVRAALRFVTAGEADAAIVYATDAIAAADKVRVVAAFSPDSHAPVVYPVALTVDGSAQPQARAMLAFLMGPEARNVFESHGFTLRPAN